MKRFPWAVAGVLAALTALPTLASASGDSVANSLRTRGTDLFRRPAPASVVVPTTAAALSRQAAEGMIPPDAEPAPLPSSMAAAELAASLLVDVAIFSGVGGITFEDTVMVDVKTAGGQPSPETVARLRQEEAATVTIDVPLVERE